MIKYFYMALINATFEGRPVAQFNTVSAVEGINVTALRLNQIQQGAADMVMQQGIQFDDVVVQNLFLLTPMGCTEEEFTANTQLSERAMAEAQASDLMAQADAAATDNHDPHYEDNRGPDEDNVQAEEQLEAGKQGE
jgi:hypothetical protein